MIWDKAKFAWKFFIVATQMLENMMSNKIPTRAEVTDIFTACMQKADCTMLSWETAAWKYPIEAVSQMAKVIKYSETQLEYKHSYFWIDSWIDNDKKATVKNTVYTAESLWAQAIIIFTWSGFLAKTMSAFKPRLPVYAFTFENKVVRKLNILFWIYPFKISKESYDGNMKQALTLLKQKWLISVWDKIVNLCNIKQDWKIITSIQIRNI
jgi:pyruvate kinase